MRRRRSAFRHGLGLALAAVLLSTHCGTADRPAAEDNRELTELGDPDDEDVREDDGSAQADREGAAPEPPESRPDWLGTRTLPDRGDGVAEPHETPAELRDRRFPPPDADPTADGFVAEIDDVPPDVLDRSTWTEACPVTVDELRYVTVTFWGFDDRTYLGELIVHRSVAEEVVSVFERIYDARFPIEEMRVVTKADLDAPPTGDGNNTTAFVCRPTTLSDNWSQHAYGLAIDVNPFHNPYERDGTVLPELATAYLDRDQDLPGMIHDGDAVTSAFDAIGWGWGGRWQSLSDWMHFSQSGR
jgi:hypothetical protein